MGPSYQKTIRPTRSGAGKHTPAGALLAPFGEDGRQRIDSLARVRAKRACAPPKLVAGLPVGRKYFLEIRGRARSARSQTTAVSARKSLRRRAFVSGQRARRSLRYLRSGLSLTRIPMASATMISSN